VWNRARPHVRREGLFGGRGAVLVWNLVEGEGVAPVGGSPVPVQSGAVVQLPLGQALALENASAERPLRYLIVKAK
jgi:mannose-6-phosphate isomerase-like protein (cupin superfamily)